MRISKFIHSCLLVEDGDTRILIDPGKFSFLDGSVNADQFRDLDAILITHQHPDHVDDESLKTILANNADAPLLANAGVAEQLAKSGITAEAFESGTRTIGSVSVEAIAAAHAEILNAERPRNVAYVINQRLLHPGDSFDHSLDVCKGIDLLALPLMAPWNTELLVAEFALRIAPKAVIPIHDGYAKDFFLRSRYDNFQKYLAKHNIEFLPLAEPGATIER